MSGHFSAGMATHTKKLFSGGGTFNEKKNVSLLTKTVSILIKCDFQSI